MAKTTDAIYVVRETFFGTLDGEEVAYYRGEAVDATDPALKKWPERFAPLTFPHRRPEVEQATAAPGEKRGA